MNQHDYSTWMAKTLMASSDESKASGATEVDLFESNKYFSKR